MAVRQVDIGIITIREDEFRAVLDQFGRAASEGVPASGAAANAHVPVAATGPAVAVPTIVSGRRDYNLYAVHGYDVAVVRCLEQGNAEAQSVATDLVDDLDPQWLLVVGIAGAVPDHEYTLGDVIVSSRIHDLTVSASQQGGGHSFAIAGGGLHPRAQGKVANLVVYEAAVAGWNDEAEVGKRPTQVWAGTGTLDDALYGDDDTRAKVCESLVYHDVARPPRVVTGAIASSDRLVKDTELVALWRQVARQVKAVEMESAGIYKLAFNRTLPFVAIRGISDIVGLRRSHDWTGYACRTAAAFARAFLKTRPCEPRASASTAAAASVSATAVSASPSADSRPDPQAAKQLEALLASMYTAGDLRKLVYYHFEPAAYDELPGDKASKSELAFAIVRAAVTRNCIDAKLFQVLLDDRLGRKDEIAAVARLLLSGSELSAFERAMGEQIGHDDPPSPPDSEPRGDSLRTLRTVSHLLPQPMPRSPGADALVHDIRLVLDRVKQWAELKVLCAKPTGSFTCLVHGDASQDLTLFLERVELHLSHESQVHRICRVAFRRDETRIRTVAEWEQRLCREAGYAGFALDEALARVTATEPVLFIIGDRPLRGLDQVEREALVAFLQTSMPEAIRAVEAKLAAAGRMMNGVRVLVPVEHEQHAVGLDDALTCAVYEAIVTAARRELCALPSHDLIELRFPPWEDVERYLRRVNDDRRDRDLELRAVSLYERIEADPDPHERSFARLASELQTLLAGRPVSS
ncbi:hypothetical protein [Haliangium sp.]|uniref:5'-methylthioadenosine/S-adenosylhomocysteine nucleosidase family protein n=1 Tax=Haliangium sp. TaxID=2663208 RepID=UPI003D13144C